MHPELFNLGDHPVRAFGLLAASGLLAAYCLMYFRSRRGPVKFSTMADIVFFAMIGALAGARLLYVVRNWNEEFSGEMLRIFMVSRGGIVWQGGFLGGLFAGWLCCRWKKCDFLSALDILAPCIALGHAFGRVGCYLNGCCFGAICSDSAGVRYPKSSLPYNHQLNDWHNLVAHHSEALNNHFSVGLPAWSLPVHPTQLYSAAANLLICGVLVAVTRRVRCGGQLFALYLGLYGVWRFIIEFLRDDQSRHLGLSVAQYIALIQLAAGVALWMWALRRESLNKEAVNV